jgi:hypothetical protein
MIHDPKYQCSDTDDSGHKTKINEPVGKWGMPKKKGLIESPEIININGRIAPKIPIRL